MSPAHRVSDARPPRVLVVDDEAGLRALMRGMLEREGFDVVEAANGREAMRAFLEHPVDVVVTDIFMPEEDGIELIAELRACDASVPVIAISGGGRIHDGTSLHAAELLGASDVLEKPFRSSALLDAILRVTGADGGT
jgi:CheY-like chemotaxis protein